MKNLIKGAVTLMIGGAIFTVSQSDIVKNFVDNTGMNQQQAEKYINNIKQSDLASFSKIGADLVTAGNKINSINIDCVNYSYKWETSLLGCEAGKNQLQKIANDEILLGNCYKELDTNLGDSIKAKMNECVTDIDITNTDYDLPIVSALLDSKTITESFNTNSYNKSVLQAALSK